MAGDVEKSDRLSILSHLGIIEQNALILHSDFADAFLSATRKSHFQIISSLLDVQTADECRALSRLLEDMKRRAAA